MIAWKGQNFGGKILNIEVCDKKHIIDSEENLQESPPASSPEPSQSDCPENTPVPELLLEHARSNLVEMQIQQDINNAEISNVMSEILFFHKASNYKIPRQLLHFHEKSKALNPFLRTKRGRKKKGEIPENPITCIDQNTIQAYGSIYTVKKLLKHSDEDTIVKCKICNRRIKKKSIRSHAISEVHQVNYLATLPSQ